MLFGPSDPFAFPICLLDSHGFDSCLNALDIRKCFLQNKYFIALYQQIGEISAKKHDKVRDAYQRDREPKHVQRRPQRRA
jgi:hypothetical protein